MTGISVDDFWTAWSKGAEVGLFRAYCGAGGPVASDVQAFLGKGQLRIRWRRLGSRAVGGSAASRLRSSVKVMRLMLRLLSSLSTLLFHLFSSSVGV